MKTKAMVLESFKRPLVMREIEIPPLNDGEILVRMKASGVCGSDVHQQRGEDPRIPLPIILGHEGVGVIEDISGNRSAVDGLALKTGDQIIWNRGMTCGECFYCASGEFSLCSSRKVFGINMSCAETPFLNGCYANHLILRKNTDIFVLAEHIDPSILVSASCSGATVAHAFSLVDTDLGGQTVVVQGPGPLGVFAVAFAKSRGASNIVVIGGSQERLDLCRNFGATLTLNRHNTSVNDRHDAVTSLTDGRGADIAVEAAGAQGAAEEGIRLLRKGGVYLTTGYSQPAGTETIDFYSDIVSKNIRIQGVWVSDTSHLKSAVNLVLKNPDIFANLVTHRFALEDANNALDAMAAKTALKAVLEMK